MHNHYAIRYLILSIISLCFVPTSLFSQAKEIDMGKREAYLLQLRKDFRAIAFKHTDQTYALADSFNQELIKTLALPESFEHPFDSLQTKIGIQTSADGSVKVYSWYHSYGGNWHDIRSFAQLKTPESFDALSLHSGYTEGKKIFNDVSYGPIQSLLTKNGLRYILRGWGTHGSGHHHLTMRAFRLEAGKLVECKAFFDGKSSLVQEIPRGYELDLQFDPKSSSIIYSEFILNEDIGFFEPTGKKITLKWDGEAFSRMN